MVCYSDAHIVVGFPWPKSRSCNLWSSTGCLECFALKPSPIFVAAFHLVLYTRGLCAECVNRTTTTWTILTKRDLHTQTQCCSFRLVRLLVFTVFTLGDAMFECGPDRTLFHVSHQIFNIINQYYLQVDLYDEIRSTRIRIASKKLLKIVVC